MIPNPALEEAMLHAVKRMEERMQAELTACISKLMDGVRLGMVHTRKIPIPTGEGILFIPDTDIIRCEASGRYTILCLSNSKKLTITKTLKEIEALLQPGQFFRVHHSHIINLATIKKYHRGHGGSIELNDGSVVEVSASRKDDLLHTLLNRPLPTT